MEFFVSEIDISTTLAGFRNLPQVAALNAWDESRTFSNGNSSITSEI
jgi:hypothetical protein